MSAGGRGTRRASPQQGSVPAQADLIGAVGPAGSWTSDLPSAAKWQRRLDLTSPPAQVLTNTYAAYAHTGGAGTEFQIPYGGVRLFIIGTYTPAVANGQLGIFVRWFAPGGISEITLSVSDTSTAVFGVGGQNAVAETELFEHAVVTPAAPDTSPIIYRIPFWIPSSELARTGNDQAINQVFEVFVREAGPGAAGTYALNRLLIESFGEARPVAALP